MKFLVMVRDPVNWLASRWPNFFQQATRCENISIIVFLGLYKLYMFDFLGNATFQFHHIFQNQMNCIGLIELVFHL